MVLLLRHNVVFHISRPGSTYREGTVSGLPAEALVLRKLFVYPARRVGLHDPHQVRYRLRRSDVHKKMNVVCWAINDQRNTLSFSDNAGHVREQPGGKPRRQVTGTVLRRKDGVNEQGSEAVRHRLTPRPGAPWPIRCIPTACAVGYGLSPFGLGGGPLQIDSGPPSTDLPRIPARNIITRSQPTA